MARILILTKSSEDQIVETERPQRNEWLASGIVVDTLIAFAILATAAWLAESWVRARRRL